MGSRPTNKLFTPTILALEPKRGNAIPNHDGTKVLYYESTPTIGEGATKRWKVMDIATGESTVAIESNDAYEAAWLSDEPGKIISLQKDVDYPDYTDVMIYDIHKRMKWHRAARIFSWVHGLKVKRLKEGRIAFVVFGRVGINGELRNENEYQRPPHTGLVYDTGEVLNPGSFIQPDYRSAIFYSILVEKRTSGGVSWQLAGQLHNALANTGLAPQEFDISQNGIVFAAQDLILEPKPIRRRSHAYILQLDSFARASTQGPRKIILPDNPPDDGPYESRFHGRDPHFSPDGSEVAFGEGYSIYLYHLGTRKTVNVLDTFADKTLPWTAGLMRFARSGNAVYLTAENHGRVSIYKIDLRSRTEPELLFRGGSVTSCYPLGEDDASVLITSSSLVDGSLYNIVNADGSQESKVLSSLTNHGARLGISSSQISEIYFKGAGDDYVHAWMVKPSHFEEGRRYPVMICVHGGPMCSWQDEWDACSPFLLYAEQGYIIVAPNITGSTGFGLKFRNAIRESYGGRPYEDLVKCMDYLENDPNIDINKAVMIGISYGGYMVNWVQGHGLGRRFKAMVSTASIFDLPINFLQSDTKTSLVERNYFSGSEILWENYEMLQRFNPARPDLLPNWKTPMLITHGGADWRTPTPNAIAAFRTLQNLGTPSRLIIYPNEGHAKVKAGDILQYQSEVISWFNKYTGNAEEEVARWEDELVDSLGEDGYLNPDWGQHKHYLPYDNWLFRAFPGDDDGDDEAN
ncbi:alpha/beta-hydrolase [Daldinia caldariorum]|uniref:alpha/beta-hydrolase n=1 Tax=Daldinia caldariorum TaxID=326644 RepID=UPI002007200E|nr:alpha/beta-hydrolase [Daldinia caldariorum]KAI1468867.1 alpha/beta-hydrolase [Daldinia caldariorum]